MRLVETETSLAPSTCDGMIHHTARRYRSCSFDLDEVKTLSNQLSEIVRSSNVYLGGSAVGKGLHKAVQRYLKDGGNDNGKYRHDLLDLPGAADLSDGCQIPPEDAFYIVDIGILVSQVYQWRRFFPRVEPFYAVKCNPDPVIVKTLAVLGCNFDCASRNEIQLVQELTKDLPRKPEIIFANPCKARSHLVEAVCKGVRMVTFDNATEVAKCAAVSKKIQLILRIITDDRGSQCRLSSKFGAPRNKWRTLLAAAKTHGLQVVGVSFHVGSGCRDAGRYHAALRDAREIFDMAHEYGMHNMHILDIGGGFPGETHSIWNPAEIDENDDEEIKRNEGKQSPTNEHVDDERFMFFTEIAQEVAPVIDELFPENSGIRVIGEPGRYFVAASATLCCSVIASRNNGMDKNFEPEAIDDKQVAAAMDNMSRQEERELVRARGHSLTERELNDTVMLTIQEELADYSKLYASQQLAQQEVDVYNDSLDLFQEAQDKNLGIDTATDMLGPPEPHQKHRRHLTVEGMAYPLVAAVDDEEDVEVGGLLTLAAAGEAAVSGVVLQAVADSAPLQDDFAYYINDGVYGAFNNVIFDHATVRPRVLRKADASGEKKDENRCLYASTVFGPTCDSIDVIARSVLLPKLNVGDYMYFENMGAYTMAAAGSFNGFTPSEKLYVCSIPPEYFETLIAGPEAKEGEEDGEEKKDKY